ncbi:TPA: helix-turn-helix domain-containing protein [Streptococcus suis]
MKSIIRPKLLRYIQLVDYLNKIEGPVALDILAKELDCTTRTIRDYAVELSDQVAADILDVTIHHEKAILHFRNHSSFEDFIARIISVSTEFQILEYILFHPGCTVTELTEQFYQSSTTLYRMFAKIGPILKREFEIELKTNPCVIEGPEVQVRHFFAQLFAEKYARDEWVFTDVSRKRVEEMINHAEELMCFNVDYLPIRWLANFAVISIMRHRQGYQLEPTPWEFSLELGPERFQLGHDMASEWLIERPVLENIFSPFSVPHYAPDFKTLLEASLTQDYSRESYLQWNQLMDMVEAQIGFGISNRKQVILNMHNLSQIKDLKLFSHMIFLERRMAFFDLLIKSRPQLFELLMSEISKIQAILGNTGDEMTIGFISYAFVAVCDQLLLNIREQQPKVKILIVSNIDYFHAKTIEEQIKFYSTKQVDSRVYKGTYLTNEIGREIDHDLVLTNIPLPNYTYRPILTVKDVMDTEDLTSFQRVVRTITSDKVRALENQFNQESQELD